MIQERNMPQENVTLVIRGKTLIDGTGAEPVSSTKRSGCSIATRR
jgi:hypothetical protein